jgi:5-methylcytosine-specific restriction endonuclease McrA
VLFACSNCGALSDKRRCPKHQGNERNGSTRAWRKTRERILERDGHRCTETLADGSRCPITTDLHVDHIDPKAAGGSDDDTNLRTLCSFHNLSKGDKYPS